jgi:long-chain acyl-CoA synthetase
MPADWNIGTLLREMSKQGGRPAIVYFHDEARDVCSYAELADRVARLASGLTKAGANPGDRLLLIGPNSIDWVTVYLAGLAAGLLVMPSDTLLKKDELLRLAQAAPPRFLFASMDHLAQVADFPGSTEAFAIDAGPGDPLGWRRRLWEEPASGETADSNMKVLLLQTSGTTGAAKLFTLRMRQLGANLRTIAESGVVGPSDRLLLPLPLHHVYPQVVGLLAAFTIGATVVMPAGVTGPALIGAMHAERVTGIIAVPRLYEVLVANLEQAIRQRSRIGYGLYKAALWLCVSLRRGCHLNLGHPIFAKLRERLSPDLRLLVSGGARLDPKLAWKLAGLGFEVRSGYGLAETSALHTGNLSPRARLGNEGHTFPGGEVRIANPDETGQGEILLRGPNLFEGYLDPEKNRDAFTPDGWFRTGDLGHLDSQGFLSVTGRVKETIVLGGGKKVNPEDLERRYGKTPFITEIAVLESEGKLVALVRIDRTALTAAGLVRAENPVRVALAEAAQGLPSYQQLAGFALVNEPLPRTRLGKLRRFLLPELYRAAKSGGGAADQPEAKIEDPLLGRPRTALALQRLRARYHGKPASLDDYLALDLGIDSLEWMSLALELEQRLGIDLGQANLERIVTVRDLLEAVTSAPEAEGAKSPGVDTEAWTRPVKPWQGWIARRLTGLNRLLVKSLFGIRAAGLGNLPAQGPYVIACNHLSYLDAPAIAAALPPERLALIHWGAAEHTLPLSGTLRWLYIALKVFPLAEADPALGLACARQALDSKEALVVFPEGWRSPDGTLQAFLPGLGHFLSGSTVPVVPAFIQGTFEALPRHSKRVRFTRIRVDFAPAVSASELEARGNGRTAVERITNALHGEISALAARVQPPPA